jgi:hypothetical protein
MTSASDRQTLALILDDATTSALHEESAIDFLETRRIHYFTHNRQTLLTHAFRNGWRPA